MIGLLVKTCGDRRSIGEIKPTFWHSAKYAHLNPTQSGAIELQFGGLSAVRSRFFRVAGEQF